MSDQVHAVMLRLTRQRPLKAWWDWLSGLLAALHVDRAAWNRGWVALTLLLVGMAWAAAPGQAQDALDPSQPPPERSRALAALSLKLVETAQSGQGHASGFRIDVAHYREALRDLVKDSDALPEKDRLPRTLVLDMVRMAALLQSAAQCQTGRYIVCPPDLMERLQRQQALVEQGLAPQPVRH